MRYETLKKQVENEKVFYGTDQCPDGTVYTPDTLADAMVQMALNRFARIRGYESYETMPIALWEKIRILDMACGTGQLILSYVKVLERYLSNEDIVKWIQTHLVVMDIDPVGLGALEELLRLKYNALIKMNSFCTDALFYTHEQPYDIVLGNPPYIGEKGHKALFATLKSSPWSSVYYEGKMDYFYFFIYKGFECLKEDGVLCYITSNYFLTADGASKLRRFMATTFHIADFLDYDDDDVFRGRKLHACTYTLVKRKPKEVCYWEKTLTAYTAFENQRIFDDYGAIRFIKESEEKVLMTQMKKRCELTLGECFHLYQGIVSGLDRFDNNPCFVFTKEEADLVDPTIQKALKPFYKNSQIRHFIHEETPNYYILYQNSKDVSDEITAHLAPYRAVLEKRREVEKKSRAWYQLTWPRKMDIFIGEKIVVPQRAIENYFAYDDGVFFASADVYFIKAKEKSPYHLKVLCALLNSSYYKRWLYHFGKRKGKVLELYATPLKQLPLPMLSDSVKCELEKLVDNILEFGFTAPLREELESILEKEFTNISM